MQIDELKKAGAIYLDHIQEGFEKYDWEEYTLCARDAVEKLDAEWKKCGKENAWADFYYFILPEDGRKKIEETLTDEEKRYLQELKGKADGIIFPLDEQLIRLLAKLNEKEMLFSTFYFMNPESTWWGNYGGTYVVFRKK